MFSVNLHEFKPIQALDCINLNMIIHKYELLPGLIGASNLYGFGRLFTARGSILPERLPTFRLAIKVNISSSISLFSKEYVFHICTASLKLSCLGRKS